MPVTPIRWQQVILLQRVGEGEGEGERRANKDFYKLIYFPFVQPPLVFFFSSLPPFPRLWGKIHMVLR